MTNTRVATEFIIEIRVSVEAIVLTMTERKMIPNNPRRRVNLRVNFCGRSKMT